MAAPPARLPGNVPVWMANTALPDVDLGQSLFRYRLSSFPAPELDHIRYVSMIDDRRARDALGYAPRHGLRDTVFSVEDG